MHQVYTSKGLAKYSTLVNTLVYTGKTTMDRHEWIKPEQAEHASLGSRKTNPANSSSGSFGLLATVSPRSGGTVL